MNKFDKGDRIIDKGRTTYIVVDKCHGRREFLCRRERDGREMWIGEDVVEECCEIAGTRI